jgi:hypothetical protein
MAIVAGVATTRINHAISLVSCPVGLRICINHAIGLVSRGVGGFNTTGMDKVSQVTAQLQRRDAGGANSAM